MKTLHLVLKHHHWGLVTAGFLTPGLLAGESAPPAPKPAPGALPSAMLAPSTPSSAGPAATRPAPARLASTARPGADRAAGTIVAIHPGTGRIRPPTQTEVQALTQGQPANASFGSEQILVRHYPNGMVSAIPPESYLHVLSATLNPDGTLSYHCHSDKDVVDAKAVPMSGARPASTTPVNEVRQPTPRLDRPVTPAPLEEK